MAHSPQRSQSFATPSKASKRHSLNISIGPRPLHLVDGNVPAELSRPSPATAPLSRDTETKPLFSPRSADRAQLKKAWRQSSISYLPPEEQFTASPRPTLSRGKTANSKRHSLFFTPGDRRSLSSQSPVAKDQPPLTIFDQHSDLLRSIAQKELICLEFRSQLAVHEAELAQLKRQWEKIINLGFSKPGQDDAEQSSSSQSGGAVLDGIKGGVQGVGRLIAAGLSIGDASPPSSASTPSLSPARQLCRSHSANRSSSSVSTLSTNKSTRFSQSSTSSIGEEPPASSSASACAASHTRGCEEQEEGDETQVLMVQDTGATPTMSPNPAFVQKQEQHRLQVQHQTRQATLDQLISPSPEIDSLTLSVSSSLASPAAKVHRRKSRDNSHLPGADLISFAQESSSLVLSPSSSPTRRPPSSTMSYEHATRRDSISKAKRLSVGGTAFPSSIPGLGSLTVAAAAAPPMSSWVQTVGKKWEELQRGSTLSKSSKRASLILSDMSLSIASVLSPSPQSASASSLTPPPPYFSPLSPSSATTSTSSTSASSKPPSLSLLDDDDGSGALMSSTTVMTPESKHENQHLHQQPLKAAKMEAPPSSSLKPARVSPVQTKGRVQPQSKLGPGMQPEEDKWNW